MRSWPTRTVAELQAEGLLLVEDGNHGEYRPRPSEFVLSGVAFIRAADMTSGIVDFRGASKINALARNRIRKGVGKEQDVLLSHKGTVGKVAFVPAGSPEFVCSPQTTFWRSLKRSAIAPGYLRYYLQSPAFRALLASRSAETDMAPYVSLTEQRRFEVPLPPIEEQRGIEATLGALDDKIESNRRACRLLRELGQALVADAGVSHTSRLRDVTSSIARGVTPKYADDDPDSPLVVNQKCVRDGRVSLSPARRMVDRQVAAEKRASSGDVLVNSTGTGTLGRVGRWHAGDVFADSHVSIVKTDLAKIGSTLLAYLMFTREVDIEGMATGSTGQTELSPSRIGDLVLDVPDESQVKSLEPILLSFESRSEAFEVETSRLTQLRDTLLPELLSGRIRVPEARDAVAEITDSV